MLLKLPPAMITGKASSGNERTVSVTRAKIDETTVYYEMLERHIGYIQITKFRSVSVSQFSNALNDLLSQGAVAFVFDVRNNGGGVLKTDDKFLEYYQGAKNAGLLVGAYFFSQAISEEEAVEEAVLTAQQLEGLDLDFPVAYDWEIIYDDEDGARTDNVPVDVLTDCTLAFCQNMEAFGYRAMIYQNKRTSLLKLDLPRLQDYPFWLAEYGDGPTYIYDYDMWQYSCTGTVDGITGAVDLNLCFYDYSQDGDPEIVLDPPAGDPKEPDDAQDDASDAGADSE